MAKKKMTPVEELTYEQAFRELAEIVQVLDENDRALEEMISLFERGQELAAYCEKLLDQAALKVEQIVGDETVALE